MTRMVCSTDGCGALAEIDGMCATCFFDAESDEVPEGYLDADEDNDFADPGGLSTLRRATPDNPRILPCPTCGRPNRLTPKDRELGYQCDACATRLERGW